MWLLRGDHQGEVSFHSVLLGLGALLDLLPLIPLTLIGLRFHLSALD